MRCKWWSPQITSYSLSVVEQLLSFVGAIESTPSFFGKWQTICLNKFWLWSLFSRNSSEFRQNMHFLVRISILWDGIKWNEFFFESFRFYSTFKYSELIHLLLNWAAKPLFDFRWYYFLPRFLKLIIPFLNVENYHFNLFNDCQWFTRQIFLVPSLFLLQHQSKSNP